MKLLVDFLLFVFLVIFLISIFLFGYCNSVAVFGKQFYFGSFSCGVKDKTK